MFNQSFKQLLILLALTVFAANTTADDSQSAKTLETAKAFLMAAGSGDMKQLDVLMADDFVWYNEGDASIPWIGKWEGKEKVLHQFMPAFGAGLEVTS